jgi:hypothetical protein
MREKATQHAEQRSAATEGTTPARLGVAAVSLVYRITARAGDPIGEADTLDEVLELAKGAPPGPYRLDKCYSDPTTGTFRSWEWGSITKGPRGGIKLTLPPWID